MPTGRSLCRSGRSSPHTRRSSSHCHSTRRISMSLKTSRASSQRLRSRKKSEQESEPKPSSRLRPASPTTSSSPNWPRITASRTGSSSSLPRWGRNSSRPCQSGSFTASGLRRLPKWSDLGSRPGSTSGRRPWPSCSNISAKRALTYYWVARGVDERPVRADRIRKSVGAENTFPADLFTYEAARDALREIVDKVWGYCEGSGARGRTVTLKVKFANFQITRSRTGQTQIRTRSELEQLGNALLEPLFPVAKGVRLLGVSLSSLAVEEAEREPEFRLPP